MKSKSKNFVLLLFFFLLTLLQSIPGIAQDWTYPEVDSTVCHFFYAEIRTEKRPDKTPRLYLITYCYEFEPKKIGEKGYIYKETVATGLNYFDSLILMIEESRKHCPCFN